MAKRKIFQFPTKFEDATIIQLLNKEIQQMFAEHEFTKEYYALVTVKKSSCKIPKKFTVEKFMGRISSKAQAGKWGSLAESKGGQFSKTEFEFIKECIVEGKKCFLIKCNLFTGRTHQIRVHLSEEGFPIFGDQLYGGEAAKRIYLHACHLSAPDKFDVSAPWEFY